VFSRGNRRQPIYTDERDRWRYLALLRQVVERMEWLLLCYCQMGNHVHLLIETRTPNLGAGMQRLHGGYARFFNQRHKLTGHLFQDRYDWAPVRNDPQLWTVAAYIANNPVKAQFCRTAADWPWGSHAAIAGDRAPDWLATERLGSYFGSHGGDGLTRYLEFVEAAAKPQANLNGDSPLLGLVKGLRTPSAGAGAGTRGTRARGR
jgi:REP element-mobilizing transposase RayT